MIGETQLTLDQALARAERAMVVVELNANDFYSQFSARASAFVVDYLSAHGAASGEAITNACRAAGIVPHDDRAFGPVYQRLARSGRILKCGYCPRTKGHGTSGGIVWRLAA
jgi:hypothetical protein